MPVSERRNAARRRRRLALRLLLILLMTAELLLLAIQEARGTEFVRDLPVAVIQVSGGSMEPVLHNGDAILIRQVPFTSLTEGNIIVFSRDGELIVHEIVERGESSVITKGTANPVPDEPVGELEYRARMVAKIPGLGSILNIYGSTPRFLLFATLLILLFFGDDIFSQLYDTMQKHRQ